MTPGPQPRRIGLWITLAVALMYCSWLGWHWLPLSYSDKELAASASRVWDIKTELLTHHQLPWWTPNFMSGSSYAINHSRGFYLLPWLALSTCTDLATAGKLMALLAIFASAITMYFCARHFLGGPASRRAAGNEAPPPVEWAAVLAAIAFMLHPEQIIRAAGAEHMTISLFFPFIPLLWLTFARLLETGGRREIGLFALVAVLAMWTDNKQAVIHFLYLGAYLVYWLWPKERRANPAGFARTFGWLAASGLVLGAFIIIPGLIEMKQIKLFAGDPLAGWQKNYAFRSLFALVDRDGTTTKATITALMTRLQTHPPTTQGEVDALQHVFGLQMDSPEKYAGLVFLVALAATALWNYRRQNRNLFWFFVGMLLLSVMLATGLGNVLTANLDTLTALASSGGVPGMVWLSGLALAIFLILFARRKLTSQPRWLLAGATLAAFLFLPVFSWIAHLPYFKDIRAPYSFYDGPSAFWVAILLGFFVTDVVRSNIPKIVAGLAVLLLIDYWPYQKPTVATGVPASTIQNLEAAYGSLRQDKDWVKTYSISGRYFHLLGPLYSGKPQVYEAFYNWQAPLGLGLLNQAGGGSPELLNLLSARYIVLDKTDPGMAQQTQLFAAYRKMFPVAVENEDFVILRNNTAHPYVSATTRACLYTGGLEKSAPLALALSARNFTLVDHDPRPQQTYDCIYNDSSTPSLPAGTSAVVPLSDVQLTRENHQQIQIKLTTPQACIAVISESWYPYWHADVDGQRVEVLRVNCGLMGVAIGTGAHEIRLHYRPPAIYAGAGAVSLLGLLVCLGMVLTPCPKKS